MFTARDISQLLHGTLEGNPDVAVSKPAKIEEGEPGAICFLANPKYYDYAYTTKASVLLVGMDFVAERPISATLIRVPDVYSAVSVLFEHYQNAMQKASGSVDSRAYVHPDAVLGAGVTVGPFAYVGNGAKVGAGTCIHAQVFVDENVSIGESSILHPGVRVMRDCKIGNHVIIQPNAVIGGDGFGFAPQADGSYKKIPQIGNVVIGDHVEIGANCTIDRASVGSTIIEEGVKLDNLIMVAHNVVVGAHTVIAAQAGIAGSTHIGKHCLIGGQAGFVGHIKVADRTRVQAQSGVAKTIEEAGKAFYGSPAIPYNDYLRSYAVFRNLPELSKKIDLLKK